VAFPEPSTCSLPSCSRAVHARSPVRRGGAGAKQRTTGAAVGRLHAAGTWTPASLARGQDSISATAKHCILSHRGLQRGGISISSGSIRAHDAAAFVTAHGSLDLFAQPPSTTAPAAACQRTSADAFAYAQHHRTPRRVTASLPRRALGAAPPSHPPRAAPPHRLRIMDGAGQPNLRITSASHADAPLLERCKRHSLTPPSYRRRRPLQARCVP
jgi:hypothetical protein